MSRRGKHVTTSAMQDNIKAPAEGQAIVRALHPRGGNIFEVEHPDRRKTLVLLPSRFQKKLWVKNGGYLIIEESAEAEVEGNKITGNIVAVLFPQDVKDLKRGEGVWPPEFNEEHQEGTGKGEARDKEVQGNGLDDSSEDDGLPPLEPNNNRRVVYYSESDSGSNSDG
eukprot:jgi/Tetstr1/420713/TSEL_011796.t1